MNIILKNCNSCGTENPEDAKFCFSCGYSFAAFQPSTNVNRKDPIVAAIFGFFLVRSGFSMFLRIRDLLVWEFWYCYG